ncbi:MAG: anti-sigma factor [Acidimicrobiales bacterium]
MPEQPGHREVGSTGDGEDDLMQLRALGRRVGAEPVEWETPPDGLWDRIAAATAPPVASTAAEEAPTVRSLAERSSPRHGGPAPWVLLVAASVALIAGLAAVIMTSVEDDDANVLASSALERLGDAGDGQAELVDRDGSLELRVETSGLDAGDGFLEVWLIDPDVTRLVSLGPLRSDGVYNLPPGLDPESFPIVDVSVEPIDGDPTHSGDSVLRGQLDI